jgi:TetR/AcrR family transcriptional repressor of bet genes
MTRQKAASGAQAPAPASETLLRQRQRQKLIDACITALYLHGPSRTTIDKVVAIADMSPGIVNFYFETKAALLMAALEFLAVEFEERVLAPLEALRAEPVQALQRLIQLYLDPDIASPRKVSVWYAFWGEASSRREYYAVCGKRDVAFADLVRDLVARLIAASGTAHLDADAVSLGLTGSLEMIWQEIAFRQEADIDREGFRRRCQDYLRSVFPAQFGGTAGAAVPLPEHTAGAPGLGWAMLIAAEMTLAGVPALAVPRDWAAYDVIAQPPGRAAQRVAVRLATPKPDGGWAGYENQAGFDWLAIIVPGAIRRVFIVPSHLAGGTAMQPADSVDVRFSAYENNFHLAASDAPRLAQH